MRSLRLTQLGAIIMRCDGNWESDCGTKLSEECFPIFLKRKQQLKPNLSKQ